MATRLYLTNDSAPYSPATLRGAWDATGAAVTKLIDPAKEAGSDQGARVTGTESSTTNNYDILLYRGVSPPLAAQTISGTLNVCTGVSESGLGANAYYHVHAYVTQGDSDTPRGTILTDFIDGTEWPADGSTTANAYELDAAQSLSSLAVSAGDRLVVEIGVQMQNVAGTSVSGYLYYGRWCDGTPPLVLLDAADGEPAYRSNDNRSVGWVQFSADLAWDTSANLNFTQAAVETAYSATTVTLSLTQFAVEVLLGPSGVQSGSVVGAGGMTFGGQTYFEAGGSMVASGGLAVAGAATLRSRLWSQPDSLTSNTGGITSGALEDAWSNDGNWLVLSEVSGTPGFDHEFRWPNTGPPPAGMRVRIRGYYEGNASHVVNVEEGDGAGNWVTLGQLPDAVAETVYQWTITSRDDVVIRIKHTSAGNPTHDLHLDQIELEALPGMIGAGGATFAGDAAFAAGADLIGGGLVIYGGDAAATITRGVDFVGAGGATFAGAGEARWSGPYHPAELFPVSWTPR